jgi:hypothetical protein
LTIFRQFQVDNTVRELFESLCLLVADLPDNPINEIKQTHFYCDFTIL